MLVVGFVVGLLLTVAGLGLVALGYAPHLAAGMVAPFVGGAGAGAGGVGVGMSSVARRTATITALETATAVDTTLDTGASKPFSAPSGARRLVGVGVALAVDFGTVAVMRSIGAIVKITDIVAKPVEIVVPPFSYQTVTSGGGFGSAPYVSIATDIPIESGGQPTVNAALYGSPATAPTGARVVVVLYFA